MLAIALGAYASTPPRIRASNRFTFGPLIEVAVLFAGIFVAMAPALAILNVRGEALGLHAPWQFFWASGALSSFLDNAPTYLAFPAAAAGVHGVPAAGRYLAHLCSSVPRQRRLLAAVSVGSVVMGANSYIGNGPNFVVKAIAEENGVVMPSFFGYLAYSAGSCSRSSRSSAGSSSEPVRIAAPAQARLALSSRSAAAAGLGSARVKIRQPQRVADSYERQARQDRPRWARISAYYPSVRRPVSVLQRLVCGRDPNRPRSGEPSTETEP
jgi:hypothetical protein